MEEIVNHLVSLTKEISGFIYPNEIELHWGLLVVIYPYVTGLVAGAFILASLEKVFRVKEVEPTYRLALLTAPSFLTRAPPPPSARGASPGGRSASTRRRCRRSPSSASRPPSCSTATSGSSSAR